MKNQIIIYHGSSKIIKQPEYGLGNPRNDYGLGFYCTEHLSLAKEWACSADTGGFANAYNLDLTSLNILALSEEPYHILNWLSILLDNRYFSLNTSISIEARDYLFREFLPEGYRQYDIIIGYRADDSYFSFANDFLNNTISLEQLQKAMYLGNPGNQIVLKSRRAFSRIQFISATPCEKEIYYPMKRDRDQKARDEYFNSRNHHSVQKEHFMIDILRERWTNRDVCLR